MVGLVRFAELKELFSVGLFDAIREKAGELLSGATEKAGELAGDLPVVGDLSQSASDAAGQAGDVAGQASEHVTGAAENVGAAATDVTGSVTDAVDPGNLPEVPPEYRP
jgi:uncharacterized protein YjbJ (UPF0337 family)